MSKFDFGEFVKKVREERKLDLDFCSNNLKIHRKFLEGIENNNYQNFNNYFQAQGFVQNYLEFLELNVSDYLPRWRKEYYDEFSHDNETTRAYYQPKKKRVYNFSLSLTSILYILAGSVVLGFLIWAFISYQSLLSLPNLEITSPKSNNVVEADLIDVFGKTDQDAILKINNEKYTIQTDGNFSTSLKLSEGINNFKFSAVNPYGKESVKILVIIYRPKKIEVYNPPVENTEKGIVPESKIIKKVETNPVKAISTKPESNVKTNPKNSLSN